MADSNPRRTHAKKTEPTPSETLQAIRDWARRNGRPPSEDEWTRTAGGQASAEPVLRCFGSWKGGLAAAGYRLEPGHRPGLDS